MSLPRSHHAGACDLELLPCAELTCMRPFPIDPGGRLSQAHARDGEDDPLAPSCREDAPGAVLGGALAGLMAGPGVAGHHLRVHSLCSRDKARTPGHPGPTPARRELQAPPCLPASSERDGDEGALIGEPQGSLFPESPALSQAQPQPRSPLGRPPAGPRHSSPIPH